MKNGVDTFVYHEGIFLFVVCYTKAVPKIEKISLSVKDSLRLIFLVEEYCILGAYFCFYNL